MVESELLYGHVPPQNVRLSHAVDFDGGVERHRPLQPVNLHRFRGPHQTLRDLDLDVLKVVFEAYCNSLHRDALIDYRQNQIQATIIDAFPRAVHLLWFWQRNTNRTNKSIGCFELFCDCYDGQNERQSTPRTFAGVPLGWTLQVVIFCPEHSSSDPARGRQARR